MNDCVKIYETVMRDGFQSLGPGIIPTDQKVSLGKKLREAGFQYLEITSFAHPKWIPQLADAETVCRQLEREEGTINSALVPNVRAMERAVAQNVEEVITVCSASESHSRSNLNKSLRDGIDQVLEIAKLGRQKGMRVRGSIATAFGCPFEGEVPQEQVVEIALEMEAAGMYEIALGDTTGMANPLQVQKLSERLLQELKHANLALHFHQSGGIEFANVFAGYQAGVRVFDGSAGGLGGCPYAPGALGNVDSVRLVQMFTRMGVETHVDLEKAIQAGHYAQMLCAVATRTDGANG